MIPCVFALQSYRSGMKHTNYLPFFVRNLHKNHIGCASKLYNSSGFCPVEV